jgi:RND superfamily putative drug exporter
MGIAALRPSGGSAVTRTASWLVARLGVLLIPIWIAAAVFAATSLPSITEGADSPLGALVPAHSKAAAAEREEYARFRSTMLSRVAVVQHDSRGLPKPVRKRTVARAVRIDRHEMPRFRHVAFALPLVNRTTTVTYLYYAPATSTHARLALAKSYAELARNAGDPVTGVTGVLPARLAEFDEIEAALPRVALGTVLLVAFVLLLVFRAPGPPILTLGAAAIAYTVSIHLLPWVGERLGHSVPRDVEPVLIALVLGLVTDYSIFFLHGMRRRLAAGETRVRAADAVTATNMPIVLTAGLIVTLGSATLVVGHLEVFRAFGPGMAVTVLVSLAVALTFIPGALALLGPALFWPSLHRGRPEEEVGRVRGSFWRLLTRRPAALAIAVGTTAVLTALAFGLRDTALGFTLLRGQPAKSHVKKAAEAAQKGFANGIVSPTELLLQGDGLGGQRPRVAALERALRREPGVANVIGPAQQPRGVKLPVFVSPDGKAVRLALVLREEPLGASAIDVLDRLQERLPALLDRARLHGARASWAGDTALAQETVALMRDDAKRVAGAVLLVNLVLLVLFLRALVAPLYLLAASVLGLAAALGLTTAVFQGWLGHEDLTYYVPFAAAVLLLSLGSDYNVFLTGRIWQEAQHRSIRDAVRIAGPRASGAISAAGITLAASFAMLALVPIRPMRELAFAMSVGIILDTFVVRSLLVPSLIVLFGRLSWWPRRAGAPSRDAPPELPPEAPAEPEPERAGTL